MCRILDYHVIGTSTRIFFISITNKYSSSHKISGVKGTHELTNSPALSLKHNPDILSLWFAHGRSTRQPNNTAFA